MLLLPNMQEMPLESPWGSSCGVAASQGLSLHTQPISWHLGKLGGIQRNRVPSEARGWVCVDQRTPECFGLEGL